MNTARDMFMKGANFEDLITHVELKTIIFGLLMKLCMTLQYIYSRLQTGLYGIPT